MIPNIFFPISISLPESFFACQTGLFSNFLIPLPFTVFKITTKGRAFFFFFLNAISISLNECPFRTSIQLQLKDSNFFLNYAKVGRLLSSQEPEFCCNQL